MTTNGIHFTGIHAAQAGATVQPAVSGQRGVDNVTPLRPRHLAGTSYGSHIMSARSRHEGGVSAVAARYERFEDALLPMVLASGVGGDAAIKVAAAIMANDGLRAQARHAHQQARASAAASS
jgi:hypothetical protein